MSNQKEVTPWFDGRFTPCRDGVYQRIDPIFKMLDYSHWNGRFWGGWAEDIAGAMRLRENPSLAQKRRWRGLAQEPKP